MSAHVLSDFGEVTQYWCRSNSIDTSVSRSFAFTLLHDMLFRIVFLLCLLLTGQSLAGPVAVSSGAGEGQGYLFSYRGNCFLILPKHVHGRGRKVDVATTAPVLHGLGEILNLKTVYDLSLAYVPPGLESHCSDRWADLPDDVSSLLDENRTALMTRISGSGVEERVMMTVTGVRFDEIDAVPVDSNTIFKGTSGGFMFIDDVPVAMAIDAEGTDKAVFLRMDEIRSELARLVESRGPDVRVETIGRSDRSQQESGCGTDSVPIRSVACDKPSRSPELACAGLRQGDPAEIAPESLPVDVFMELDVADAVPVREIEIRTELDQDVTAPKSVTAYVDASSGSGRRWRRYGSADVSPRGELTLENGSGPYARRVKVHIASSWGTEEAVRISCISVR